MLNSLTFSVINFINRTVPVTPGPQLTFPSIQDGASFRVPQQTRMNRIQLADTFSLGEGKTHSQLWRRDAANRRGLRSQRLPAGSHRVCRRTFPIFDHNGDGRIDDNDLLFAVTLRSATPDRPLIIPDADNNHFAFFIQDDWRVHPQLTLNLGLRYELDTDVKNVSRTDELNPLILPFLSGERERDKNNFGPRVGFNWSTRDGRTSVHGGYGIYYDRVTLEIQSLERGLDGRSLAIEVRAGNVFFLDPNTGMFPSVRADHLESVHRVHRCRAQAQAASTSSITSCRTRWCSRRISGIEQQFGSNFVLRADYLHNFGTHFIIGRTIGTVFNPVVGGPDRVVNLESSVKTKYDGLLVSLEKRFSNRYQFRASYTLSSAFNYANDDQIPFAAGPIDSTNLQLEYGPTPNDQRHRFTLSGVFELPGDFRLAPIWTMASGVPMDILLPDASTRDPFLQRNAGGAPVSQRPRS